MNNEQVKEILIQGMVIVEENPISVLDFTDKFIEWLESNDWYYGGSTEENKEDD
jgi:hypothetical protein